MIKTSNSKAREYVNKQIPFKGSNTFGRWENNLYVVYSYGEHFPMFVYNKGGWYINCDKFSNTTSKHKSQLYPIIEFGLVKHVDTKKLKSIIYSQI